jgi:ATP-dependent RNA helicase RhlE
VKRNQKQGLPSSLFTDLCSTNWAKLLISRCDILLNSFDDLGLCTPVLKAVQALGYETPTPIQAQAIPKVLAGHDVLGVAQTGTGKTAAFSLPMIHRLHLERYSGQFRPIRGLILTPTRELAMQIEDNILGYTKGMKLFSVTLFGGVSQHRQVQKLRRGVDIVVATPGRLLDLMDQGFVNLQHLDYFVLDEADTMMDMGFIHDLRRVVKHIPQNRQSLFFSATMPPNILQFASTMLKDPERVEVAQESTAADTVDQRMLFVNQNDKRDLLVHLLKQDEVETALVFTRTKYGADKVVRYLKRNKIKSEAIHGNKTQPQRDRAMKAFRAGDLNILIATDIASRGIDVTGVSHVINFEVPNISETYVHRIGRTGRAGASGVAWSLVNEDDERKYMEDIQRLMDREVPVIEDHPWHNGMEDIPLHRGRGTRSNQGSKGGGGNQSQGGNRSFKKKPRNKRPFKKGGSHGGQSRAGQGDASGRGKRPSRKKSGNNFGSRKFKPGSN